MEPTTKLKLFELKLRQCDFEVVAFIQLKKQKEKQRCDTSLKCCTFDEKT